MTLTHKYRVTMGTRRLTLYSAQDAFRAVRRYLGAYDDSPCKTFRPSWLRFDAPDDKRGVGKSWTHTNDAGKVLAVVRRIA